MQCNKRIRSRKWHLVGIFSKFGTISKSSSFESIPSYWTIWNTDKRTDVWSRDFIIWKINSGLWAVVWAGLWNKRVWATFEACFFIDKKKLIFFWKYFRVRTEKLHWIKVNKSEKNGKYFLWGFITAKNLSVNTWRSGQDICSLISVIWNEPMVIYTFCHEF